MREPDDFYAELERLLTQVWDRISLFTISACFGFYSQGMQVFASVLNSLHDAAATVEARRVRELRVLVRVDENAVDRFAQTRLVANLQGDGVELRRLGPIDRRADHIQFGLFEGEHGDVLLATEPQDGMVVRALDIAVNVLAPPTLTDDAAAIRQHEEIFARYWRTAVRIDDPEIPTLRQLEAWLLRRHFETAQDEKEKHFEDELYKMLRGRWSPEIVRRQVTIEGNTLDLLVGRQPTGLVAIELKKATNDASVLKHLVGQVTAYSKVVPDVIVVILGSAITPRRLAELEDSFESARVRVVNVTRVGTSR